MKAKWKGPRLYKDEKELFHGYIDGDVTEDQVDLQGRRKMK